MFTIESVKIRRRSWLRMANIPTARLGWELVDCSDIKEQDLELVRKWISKVKSKDVIRSVGSKSCGKGLMLYGTPGMGKTTLALAIIQEIMLNFGMDELDVKGGLTLTRPCYFTTFNQIIELKGLQIDDSMSDDEDVIFKGMLGHCSNDAYNIRVLVIDDIGQEHSSLSGWQKSLLHDVLRTRFNNGLPTIITTNIKREQWAALYGDATESFINEAFAYLPITTSKGDLRK